MDQALEHRLHDRRDAGQDVDVLDLEAGRAGNRVLDQAGALGSMGHAQACLGQALRTVVVQQHLVRFGMEDEVAVEGLGDGGCGDVVVGRPDPPGRENIVVALAQGIQGGNDLGLDIGNHTRLGQADAKLAEPAADVGQVRVLGSAREDLVADDQQSRAHVGGRRAHRLLAPVSLRFAARRLVQI